MEEEERCSTEVKFIEHSRNLNVLESLRINLSRELIQLKEEMKIISKDIENLNKEIEYYSKKIEIIIDRNEYISNIINIEENNDNSQNEESIDYLIYNQLKKILEDEIKNLNKAEDDFEDIILDIDEHFSNECIKVEFISFTDIKNPENIKKEQPFRINKQTKIEEIIDKGLEFWNYSEHKSNYKVCLAGIDESFSNKTKVLDILKNHKNIMKTITFLLVPQNYKTNEKDIEIREKKDNYREISQRKSEKILNEFISKFSGCYKYIRENFNKIKYASINKKNNQQIVKKPKKVISSIWHWSLWGVTTGCFILFLIFSFLSITHIKQPYKIYYESQILKQYIGGDWATRSLQSETDVIDHIKGSLQYFLFKNGSTPLFKGVNMARFSFYLSSTMECQKDFKRLFSNNCYKPKFYSSSETTKNYDYFINKHYNTLTNNPPKLIALYFPNISEPDNVNNGIDNYQTFLDNAFRWFLNDYRKIKKIKVNGIYGAYENENDNCIDIFLNLNYINNIILDDILTKMRQSPNNFFNTNEQKAIGIDFAIQSLITNIYYYIHLLYENSPEGRIKPKLTIIPFYLNLKHTPNGKMIYIMDIFRLIFIIFIFLLTLRSTYDIYIKVKEKEVGMNIIKPFLLQISSLNNILDILLFIFYTILFSYKKSNLYKNINTHLTIDPVNYPNLNFFEYYPIAKAYELSTIYEGIVIILVIMRIIPYYFQFIPRVHLFYIFLRKCLFKIFSYFCMIVIFTFFFAIYANILWGDKDKAYNDYSSAFMKVLTSIAFHYINVFSINHTKSNYEVVYTFMFFVIMIFFELNLLFGVYIEIYRITSLKEGISYEKRISQLFNKVKTENSKIENDPFKKYT